MNEQLKASLQKIELLLLDCDGVLTESFYYFGSDGDILARFSHRDGQGIVDIRKLAKIPVIVISTQTAGYVHCRCKKLDIPCYAPVTSKFETVTQLVNCEFKHVPLDNICFVGDDAGDLETMRTVGFPVAVADAAPEVIAIAKYVTKRKGGDHAVRELCDLILEAKGIKRLGAP